VLIDSKSEVTTCPREFDQETTEYPLLSSQNGESPVEGAQASSHCTGYASSAQLSCVPHLSSSIFSPFSQPSWLAETDNSIITQVNGFSRDLDRPISQRISNSIEGSVGLCQTTQAGCLLGFVESPFFVAFTGALIMLNSCFIGYHSEQHFQQMSGIRVGDTTNLKYVSQTFAVLFLIQLVLRLLA